MRVPSVLIRRPRLVNPLHALRLLEGHTQTNPAELACLRVHANGHRTALEIGTHMGISAAVIAQALDNDGHLFCVDPWEPRNGKENPCFTICRRELRRQGVYNRVVFLQGYSYAMESQMPDQFDFMFVDGDHSYDGIRKDWDLCLRRLSRNGIVCLHDTATPESDQPRQHGSVRFFNEVIRNHEDFELVDRCHSLNVLKRVRLTPAR